MNAVNPPWQFLHKCNRNQYLKIIPKTSTLKNNAPRINTINTNYRNIFLHFSLRQLKRFYALHKISCGIIKLKETWMIKQKKKIREIFWL